MLYTFFKNRFLLVLIIGAITSCSEQNDTLKVSIVETSASGNQLTSIENTGLASAEHTIVIKPEEEYQKITGIGGSFTEASAHLLNGLSKNNRERIIEAYFGDSGAKYSLTRTHINSCDFSLTNYSYAPVPNDLNLENFSIDEDRDDIIPMIKDAMSASSEGFRIISSPWTAPPWMKDNKDWRGGKLLPQYRDVWALYFSKYLEAYKAEGIDVWGITVENEPLGNNNNWESMHFSAEEMVEFVRDHLGPRLEADGWNVQVLGYDQNRGDELNHWVETMYKDEASAKYFDGTAVHWYASTVDWYPKSLQFAHAAAPDKYLIQSEGCIDSEVPKWKDDKWYWSAEATDWGWDWAPPEQKKDHPKYVPVYRYARDMIGCFNNWVDGWVDWNMVLDKQGGPNWFKNWCGAPVIVDVASDEVYFTPLYYTMVHFSRYIRPGAIRIGFDNNHPTLMTTAVKNPDGSVAVVILNTGSEPANFNIVLGQATSVVRISPQAIQTIIINS